MAIMLPGGKHAPKGIRFVIIRSLNIKSTASRQPAGGLFASVLTGPVKPAMINPREKRGFRAAEGKE